MDLEKITVKLRPRKNWEAADLGAILVQTHLISLYKIWLLTTLPFFLLLSVLLYEDAMWSAAIFWLLKPLWERPLLHFISRELFGERLSIKQCVRSFFQLAKIQWLASLTWRRLSLTRSLDLPIIQLEGLSGNSRSQRLRIIHHTASNVSAWLTILFLLTEVLVYFGILALAFLMLPTSAGESGDLFDWISGGDSNMSHLLLNISSYLAMSLLAPFYIGCGFAVYINQRTLLEGWDLELSFKKLSKRLRGKSETTVVNLVSIMFTFLAMVLLLGGGIQQLSASESKQEIAKIENNDIDENPHQQSRTLIKQILAGEQFHQKTEVYRYVPVNPSKKESNTKKNDYSFLATIGYFFSKIIEFILWILVALFILFLISKYKKLPRPLKGKKKIEQPINQLFGLELDINKLPEKPDLVAQELIDTGEYRQALSLLYRASLIWYLNNTAISIKEGDTELECLKKVSRYSEKTHYELMQELTQHWRGLAYANIIPEKNTLIALCQQWSLVLKTVKSSEAIQ